METEHELGGRVREEEIWGFLFFAIFFIHSTLSRCNHRWSANVRAVAAAITAAWVLGEEREKKMGSRGN